MFKFISLKLKINAIVGLGIILLMTFGGYNLSMIYMMNLMQKELIRANLGKGDYLNRFRKNI
jgi:hypothetical protein